MAQHLCTALPHGLSWCGTWTLAMMLQSHQGKTRTSSSTVFVLYYAEAASVLWGTLPCWSLSHSPDKHLYQNIHCSEIKGSDCIAATQKASQTEGFRRMQHHLGSMIELLTSHTVDMRCNVWCKIPAAFCNASRGVDVLKGSIGSVQHVISYITMFLPVSNSLTEIFRRSWQQSSLRSSQWALTALYCCCRIKLGWSRLVCLPELPTTCKR